MFSQRKLKNRRLGREHVLDVKLRSSQVRKNRLRLLVLTFTGIFVLLLGSYLLWGLGSWSLRRLVYQNSSFSIQQLDVQTDGMISVSQLCRWAGIHYHDNLLALDLAQVKRNLELVPVIQSASVERILPRTLRIRVIEREPIAQVHVSRVRSDGSIEILSVLLDADGYVMWPLESRPRSTPGAAGPESLPVITALDPRELQPGRRSVVPQLQAALQLIVAFQQSPMAGLADLKAIDLSSPDVLTVKTGQAADITFALHDPEQQLRRWREIFDLGQQTGKAIATLDLAVAMNVPVQWQDPAAVPPGLPKPPKPLKKKHV